MLLDVTIYTSLESCAQWAGVMALGRVRQIVYLQTDPGMYFIGRILRNLTDDKLRAPLPITGAQIDLPYFEQLDQALDDFHAAVAESHSASNATKMAASSKRTPTPLSPRSCAPRALGRSTTRPMLSSSNSFPVNARWSFRPTSRPVKTG
jgi:hypothetical protein